MSDGKQGTMREKDEIMVAIACANELAREWQAELDKERAKPTYNRDNNYIIYCKSIIDREKAKVMALEYVLGIRDKITD